MRTWFRVKMDFNWQWSSKAYTLPTLKYCTYNKKRRKYQLNFNEYKNQIIVKTKIKLQLYITNLATNNHKVVICTEFTNYDVISFMISIINSCSLLNVPFKCPKTFTKIHTRRIEYLNFYLDQSTILKSPHRTSYPNKKYLQFDRWYTQKVAPSVHCTVHYQW